MEPSIKEIILIIEFIILVFAWGITSSNSFRFLHKMADDEWDRDRRIKDETGEKPDDSKWWEIQQEIKKENKREYVVIGAFFLFAITAATLT